MLRLTDNTIVLKLWEMTDIDQLTEALAESASVPNFRRWISWMNPNWDKTNSYKFLNDTIAINNKHWKSFGIFDNDRLIGCITLIVKDKRGTVGYWIRTSEQGKGYCKKALKLLMHYAFSHINEIKYLKFVIDVDNWVSRNIAEKFGAVKFKTIPKHLASDDGMKDAIIYRLYR